MKRVPRLVVGVLVGACFMHTPYSREDAAYELAVYCGGGLLAGLAIDLLFARAVTVHASTAVISGGGGVSVSRAR
jgi:hypothetical protein